MYITDIVNGYLTGDTNYGLGIAFSRTLGVSETTNHQYVGFFTRHTQTFVNLISTLIKSSLAKAFNDLGSIRLIPKSSPPIIHLKKRIEPKNFFR